VDFKQFDKNVDGSGIRRELGISPDNKIVLYLGGLNPVKGILILLLSAEFFLEKNCSLLIAGNMRENISSTKKIILKILKYIKVKTYRIKVEEQIAQLQNHFSKNSVTVLGIRNDIPKLLAACDILVFPATEPHFARPVIEAAAMCKPSVASNTGGLPELIDHEHTGLLVEVGDAKSLGKAIQQLLDDHKRCRIMGENAYHQAKRLFNSEKNCKMVMDIYESLLSP
jgi:glycosyltransferase involved in cell wall biosynthesis